MTDHYESQARPESAKLPAADQGRRSPYVSPRIGVSSRCIQQERVGKNAHARGLAWSLTPPRAAAEHFTGYSNSIYRNGEVPVRYQTAILDGNQPVSREAKQRDGDETDARDTL